MMYIYMCVYIYIYLYKWITLLAAEIDRTL